MTHAVAARPPNMPGKSRPRSWQPATITLTAKIPTKKKSTIATPGNYSVRFFVFFVNFVVLTLKHLNFESRVVGYYALAAGSVTRKKDVPGEIKRNMPEPILVPALCCLALFFCNV